jgi:hypothetical protein
MFDRIFQGTIDKWIDRGDGNGYGFVLYQPGGSRLDRVYFDQEGITPNNIGLRSHGKILGNLVHFRIARYTHRDKPSAKAVDIRSAFPVGVADPEAHREISVVDRLVPGSLGSLGYVFLRRKNGDSLYLSSADVADRFKSQFQELRVGQHVWHGVQPPVDKRPLWRATFAELYSPQEEAAMQDQGF